jgi:hypothetical protein
MLHGASGLARGRGGEGVHNRPHRPGDVRRINKALNAALACRLTGSTNFDAAPLAARTRQGVETVSSHAAPG